MKTNQVLIRKMGDFGVMQRTSDGMFNATALLSQWNKHGGVQKQIIHYTENNVTGEFINALLLEENLKERDSVLMQRRGKNGGTWMHPLLFIDFAMWLNPTFKVKVLKFVSDELIKYRNDAGDAYREMATAIRMIVDKESFPDAISNVAKAINYIVFGNHESEMRNKQADETLMRELLDLEKKIASLVSERFIRTYEQLIAYLRWLWLLKYQPECLAVNKMGKLSNTKKESVS